jgi:hypothetical protein
MDHRDPCAMRIMIIWGQIVVDHQVPGGGMNTVTPNRHHRLEGAEVGMMTIHHPDDEVVTIMTAARHHHQDHREDGNLIN